ncbi:MAG: amidohydrolase family protein [Maricaulaceae bacterium]|nr:amidohydrolase family protein [Maricaulaceae bacterium]
MSEAFAIVGARLVDPASGFDGPGGVLVENGVIAAAGAQVTAQSVEGAEIIDARGAILCPALIDLRAGVEPMFAPGGETPASLADAAAAGGVGTLVLGPCPATPFDAPEAVAALMREGERQPVNVLIAAGATRSLAGEAMAELGLMAECGGAFAACVNPVADTLLMRRLMAYAAGFEMWLAARPSDAALKAGTAANEGDQAARMGLPAEPAISERIAIERDAALAELTGARLLIDRVSTAEGLAAAAAARRKGLETGVTAAIASLVFNEVDAGAFDAAMRLDPPLRAEDDRAALVEAVRGGLIDAVVSDHRPLPDEAKTAPFGEAAPGSTGVETLLAALLGLVHDGQLELIAALRAVTSGPADLLGLPQGRIAEGAPADLTLFDGDAPWVFRAADGRSARRNSAFEGRRLQGRVLLTAVDGAIIFRNG